MFDSFLIQLWDVFLMICWPTILESQRKLILDIGFVVLSFCRGRYQAIIRLGKVLPEATTGRMKCSIRFSQENPLKFMYRFLVVYFYLVTTALSTVYFRLYTDSSFTSFTKNKKRLTMKHRFLVSEDVRKERWKKSRRCDLSRENVAPK